MISENAKELCRRGDALFSKRASLNSFWQETAEHFYPERADFTQTHEWGEDFGAHLFDSTPVLCRRDLGNAFASMLRPRGQPWFKCVDPDERLMEDPKVAAWYDHITDVGRKALYANRSQFIRATKEGDHDYAAFGNAVISVELNPDKDGLLFRCHHLRDCAWAESAVGVPDTMFRDMKFSARQIAQKFGAKGLHKDITDAIAKDPDKEFKVRHVMMPADDYEYENKAKAKGRKLPWVSVYLDVEHNHMLREAGSYEFRYVIPRWQTISGSPYAVSPAVTVALADARGMQTMARVLLEAGEKNVDPPMKAVMEKIRGDINLYSGGITIVDPDYDEKTGAILEPIYGGRQDVNLGVQLLLRTGASLKDAWFLSKLNLPGGAKTAYETAQIVEEFVRANIPLFEPMETEYNAAILELAYSIMMRERAFNYREMPPELEGRDFEFSFSNPLQDAIERNKINQATTVFGALAGAMQVDPTAAKTIDVKRIVRDVTRGSGAPADWLVDEAQADEEIQGQQQAGNVLAALSGAGQAAEVVNQGADAALKLQSAGMLPAPGAEMVQ
ncbi:portal protein [Enterovirga sp. CN4-39]|uniref:portal protein n=1 Tax=Enterovirga sp. CN4-39 TaxID=3400910 RepID=UPI003BFC0160